VTTDPQEYSRKEELEETLKKLQELIAIRTAQLAALEWDTMKKTSLKNFTLLNLKSKGYTARASAMKIQKKDKDLDCHISRRGLFFLKKRERDISEQIEKLSNE
jgi:hypothetical protein